MTHTFLVEIGTEELPPTSLRELSDAFSSHIINALESKQITFEKSRAYATPRRLALLVEGLSSHTPVEESQQWGPPAKIAFDADGNPTKAALAFAKKNDLDPSALQTANDGSQDKLVCQRKTGGEETKTLLGTMVSEALNALPIKKRMRWGASRVEFVRPVQWVVMMVDAETLPETILGFAANNVTKGHRFHCDTPITLSNPLDYEQALEEQGTVIADFERRRQMIIEQVQSEAQKLNGKAVISDDLLDEVTALVEWPVALAGNFDKEFLKVPAEALISSMKEHQKYFHVIDNNNALLPYFITVSNIKSLDAQQVIDGNERVIRPRLSDAAFFFESDKKQSLEARREQLKTVMFQAKLGSVYDKTVRIESLSKAIAESLGLDAGDTIRAAQLCKSDLVSSMVYEFADMQGIAGRHYALNDGESDAVALAMEEQYLPKFAGDKVPSSDAGAFIALADRLDTITGIFGIGQKPTGSKDPFALRRASLGVLRIIVERNYDLDLKSLISKAADGFSSLPARETVVDDVLEYCLERFRAWFQEDNIAAEIFQSVRAKNLTSPLDINQRVIAVAKFCDLPESLSLAEANKRVSNILNKQGADSNQAIDNDLLKEEAEVRLAEALDAAQKTTSPLLNQNKYAEALKALAFLKQPVDDFFDNVMVMCDDEALKLNRLALLHKLRELFLQVADISYLVVKN